MLKSLDLAQFRRGHEAFVNHMEKEGGVPFTGFGHPFLVDQEIDYKWRIRNQGRLALQLERWKGWPLGKGRILHAARDATDGKISDNLLEHSYGPKGNSNRALYRVESQQEIRDLELELSNFLLGDPQPESLGSRFDRFADYLRRKSLGCNWPFVAYLLFLLRPQTYFPIRPQAFDRLLKFYGIPIVLSGHVEWSKYLALLQLAEDLRELLSIYGVADTIEVQSYMWVVAYLIDNPIPVTVPTIDLEEELSRRKRRAAERERIGLAGEAYVHRTETKKLRVGGRADLADRVSFTSLEDSGAGFDIKSFKPDGEELHIEVKTTSRSTTLDTGFWLTATEHERAKTDPNWTLYRVWDIDNTAFFRDLGNVVTFLPEGWTMNVASWFFARSPNAIDLSLNTDNNG